VVRSDRKGTGQASIDDRTVTTGRAGANTPERPRRRSNSDRKKEAELFLDAIRGDLAHGRYVDPAGGLILFREYAEQWRAGQVHRPSTAALAESYGHLWPDTRGPDQADSWGSRMPPPRRQRGGRPSRPTPVRDT
jgi:hypothetical protein